MICMKEQTPLNPANTQFNSLSLGHSDLAGRNRNLCCKLTISGNASISKLFIM